MDTMTTENETNGAASSTSIPPDMITATQDAPLSPPPVVTMAIPEGVKPTITRDLPRPMSPEERAAAEATLGELIEEIGAARAGEEALKDEIKYRRERLENLRDKLGEKLDDLGVAHARLSAASVVRPVACYVIEDAERCSVTIVREDTAEVVEQRAMTAEELEVARQPRLPGIDAPAAAEGAVTTRACAGGCGSSIPSRTTLCAACLLEDVADVAGHVRIWLEESYAGADVALEKVVERVAGWSYGERHDVLDFVDGTVEWTAETPPLLRELRGALDPFAAKPAQGGHVASEIAEAKRELAEDLRSYLNADLFPTTYRGPYLSIEKFDPIVASWSAEECAAVDAFLGNPGPDEPPALAAARAALALDVAAMAAAAQAKAEAEQALAEMDREAEQKAARLADQGKQPAPPKKPRAKKPQSPPGWK